MTFALLFLTYDKFTANNNVINNLIKNNNLYIHPKYKNNVDDNYKKYIINDIIETEWCNISLVLATINLLKEAYKNKNNEWFFLLSHDSYPLYDNIETKFNKIHNNKSIFNYKSKIIINDRKYYKTSQWWVLKRDDVKIILDNNKYKYFKDFKNKCPDEYYFLTVLKWNNKDYVYDNFQIMYDVWLEHTIQKSPLYFNHILQNDINNRSLFIRKITQNFSLNIYKPKKKLYVIYIGTETSQELHVPINNEFDIILIISIDIKKIKQEIISRAIYIYNIIYKFYYETILNICNEEYIKNWDIVIFTTEKFNLNHYNSLDKTKNKLPTNKLTFINGDLENNKKFMYIKDDNNNLAFCLITK